jgi:hypothetical protein
VKQRLQAGSGVGGGGGGCGVGGGATAAEVVRLIYAEHGLRGFWAGLGAQVG